MRVADAGSTNPELLKLLADLSQGDAWAEFMGRYSPMIRSICFLCGLPPDDIEEVEAQVMLALVQIFLNEENRIRSSFRGFLKRVIGHEVYTFLAGKNFNGTVFTVDPAFLERLANQNVRIDNELEQIETCILTQLESMQRILSVVELKVSKPTWKTFWAITIQGQPVAAVADRLKIPYLTAYQRNLRVIEMIRREVGPPQ